MADILLVEDDETIAGVLLSGLTSDGYRVVWQRTGRGALQDAEQRQPDLVLLDLGLPDLDGEDVCRELRSLWPATVIVILTARQDEMDVVSGLDAGADDYLTKPFTLVEVMARVRAHLRRSTLAYREPDEHPVIVLGSLTIDVPARRVTVSDLEVPLRARELDLLVRLATDAGSAVSRETLMNDVWDENWFGPTKTLDVHMVSLRRKLAETAASAGTDAVATLPAISTLRGHGYRLELPNG